MESFTCPANRKWTDSGFCCSNNKVALGGQSEQILRDSNSMRSSGDNRPLKLLDLEDAEIWLEPEAAVFLIGFPPPQSVITFGHPHGRSYDWLCLQTVQFCSHGICATRRKLRLGCSFAMIGLLFPH